MLGLVVLSLPASAFAPSDEFFIGLEPQRIEWNHPGEQARIARANPAWSTFLAGEGAGWVARWDETTRTPLELRGPGIAMSTATEADLVRGLQSLVARHAALFGVEPKTVRPARAAHHAESDTWYVEFAVEREPGVETYRGGISARIKHGNLILLRVATAPDAPVTGEWRLDAAKAEGLAVAMGPAPEADHTERAATRRLLERWTPDGLVLRRTWEVRSRTVDPPGRWVSFVDAETGEVLHVHNEVRFVTGSVTARHHERSPMGALISSPMPLVHVTGSSTTYADEGGEYTLNGGPFQSDLQGQYLHVDNQGGSDGLLQSSSADFEWNTTDASQAEIDTYVFAHEARDWALAIAPSNGMARSRQQANVNQNNVCNAYFDGYSINFFRAGGGCTNTGENADIVHHEWGHGFHAYQLQAGYFDGSLSEGAADTVAFFQSGSNLIGPGFLNNGGAIRDVAPNRVYPNDYVNNDYYVHDNGLIFGGSMWDLWDLLVQTEGSTEGSAVAQDIFAGLLRGGPTIPQSFGEALVADDDDGNLGNGTPHSCQLVAAFAQHGLADGNGTDDLTVVPTHEPVEIADPDVKIPLLFELPPGNDCFSGVADTAEVHYRVGSRDWKSVQARVSGGDVRADLPRFAEDDFVEYWMEGVDTDGHSFRSPGSGAVAPFTFRVGSSLAVSCEKFENDGDFHGKLLEGSGFMEWDYAAPRGLGGDPASPYSGTRIWGTDLDSDGTYTSSQSTRLRSPELSTRHFEGVYLQYRRWLGVEDVAYDQATIELNGKVVWSNAGDSAGTGHTRDDQWVSHVVDLKRKADRTTARIDFLLDSDDGLEFAGWNIDDLCLKAPNTVDNRLGIGDLTAVLIEGSAGLTWTQPRHESVTRVVVVKRPDRFPTAWDDGVIVADLVPELGEQARVVDYRLYPNDDYYAVYATDGTDWGSFTIEGLNAAHLSGVEPLPGAEGLVPWPAEFATTGCGCDGAGAGVGSLGWLSLAGLLVARRRSA